MDIRNIQKTGNMFYLYLPTTWCRQNNIKPNSKVTITIKDDNQLCIFPIAMPKEKKTISIDISHLKKRPTCDNLNKLIVACYINPVASFDIKMSKELSSTELIEQKRLLGIEFLEFNGKTITCDNPITVDDPFSLLKTLLKKIKSMIYIITTKYHKELIDRYEDEVDKSRLLIEKSVVHGMINSLHQKPIELYYIAIISKELERLVDHLKELKKNDNPFIIRMGKIIDNLLQVLEHLESKKINFAFAMDFINTVSDEEVKYNSIIKSEYHKIRILSYLRMISETIIDWVVTIKSENPNK